MTSESALRRTETYQEFRLDVTVVATTDGGFAIADSAIEWFTTNGIRRRQSFPKLADYQTADAAIERAFQHLRAVVDRGELA